MNNLTITSLNMIPNIQVSSNYNGNFNECLVKIQPIKEIHLLEE